MGRACLCCARRSSNRSLSGASASSKMRSTGSLRRTLCAGRTRAWALLPTSRRPGRTLTGACCAQQVAVSCHAFYSHPIKGYLGGGRYRYSEEFSAETAGSWEQGRTHLPALTRWRMRDVAPRAAAAVEVHRTNLSHSIPNTNPVSLPRRGTGAAWPRALCGALLFRRICG